MHEGSVTVIMPMLNGIEHVAAAIDSILKQGPCVGQLLVIDDGSTDGSLELVQAIEDPRVRVIPNRGMRISAALNTGFAEASCPYIARCDCDDLFPPDRLQWQVAFLEEHPDYVAVCGGFASMDHRGKTRVDLPCGEVAEEVTEELRSGELRTHLGTYLIRTEIIRHLEGCRAFFQTAEDIDLQLRVAEQGRLWFDPRRSYLYRLHEESITHVRSQNLNGFYHETAILFQKQRLQSGQDDLQRGQPPQPPDAGGGVPIAPLEQLQGNLIGAAWAEHAAGRKLQAIRTGMRACMTRPRNLKAWRNLGALAVRTHGK